MGKSQTPYANRGPIEATSISTAIAGSPPWVWIHVISAGSGGLVVKTEDQLPHSYTALVAGDVLVGPFSEITSMTLSKIRYGDGPPPQSTTFPAAPAGTGALGSVQLAGVLGGSGTTAALPVASLAAANLDITHPLPGGGYMQLFGTAATQTASWTVVIDTFYVLNTTNTAATATLPAIAVGNDGHFASMFNAGTTAGVWTPASGDTVGGTAASNATLAGPATGVMKTLVANLATRRWIPLA